MSYIDNKFHYPSNSCYLEYMLVVKISPVNLWCAPGAMEGNMGSLFSSGEIVIFI